MYLFPAIDLRDGQVVRLHQGNYDQQKSYGHDPAAQAGAFAAAGATWLHVVDLNGARTGEMTQLPAIEKICRDSKLKVEVGGGVRTTETIDRLLGAGVSRVILGTAALQSWSWFEGLMKNAAYHHRVVLGLDAKAGKLAVSGWEKQVQATPLEVARRVSDWPLGAIVYTDISTDGTMQGPNIPATRELAAATKVSVIASGGVGTLEHLRTLRTLPLQGVIVGRALYENAFTIAEALDTVEGIGD